MSGHSKWHNIQQRKGKQDALKSNLFTKFAKAITIAAQRGGDPATNFALRLVVDKAKAGGMPKDNIDRAIKRGTGELTDGVVMEEMLYEGFGPGGTAVLVKVVTDNKNRAAAEIKHLFSKHGSSLGGAGSVQWQFEQWGIVVVGIENLRDGRVELELELIEAGAEDIADDEAGIIVKTRIDRLQSVLSKLKELNIEPVRSGIEWLAKDTIKVDSAAQEQLVRLFDELENHDDVEDFFTNAE